MSVFFLLLFFLNERTDDQTEKVNKDPLVGSVDDGNVELGLQGTHHKAIRDLDRLREEASHQKRFFFFQQERQKRGALRKKERERGGRQTLAPKLVVQKERADRSWMTPTVGESASGGKMALSSWVL